MKKKKIIIISSAFIVVFITIISLQYEDKFIIENENNSNRITYNSALTMMYETGPDTGEYQISSDSLWPQDGYVFNETLSGCENGSALTYDEDSKKVLVQANTSDKCYVYFDIFTGINIAYSEGTPTTYLYSTNNGVSWNEVVGTANALNFPVGTYIKGTNNGDWKYDIIFCSTPRCSSTSASDVTKLGTASSFSYYIITGQEVSYAYYTWVCLVDETYVYVYDNKKKQKRKKKIKDIKIGDLLYSFNDQENKYTYSKVKRVEITHAKEIYVIKLQGGETIRCSGGHNFYVAGMDYLKASQLKPGFKLLGMDNKSYEIIDINQEFYENSIKLYNLYTDKDSDNKCFVSSLGVLSVMLVLGFYLFPMQSMAANVTDSN